ncbi:acetate--CoA ligase family protein [Streptomyces sp. NPDC046821]|uniref:acetate--CoA ligase family protein n=1 Tax=Streptomyces sp. NPDC046821 TaxID=3154702 RepID=UPI0033DC6AFC
MTTRLPDAGTHARVGLDALFDPRSVAVVGASDNPEKWGYWLASGALSGRGRRSVHLVNHRGGSLDGEPFLPDLASLPVPPEHVVVAVPPRHVRPVVTDGLAAGARCFTVITSGGATVDEERALAKLVKAGGARLLGPNCMGVVDTTSELRLSWGEFPSGGLGLVSQSGNLALEIGRLLARAGQGFSRFVSLGNQRDIDAADALESLISHEPTKALAAYIEDFRDGRRLAQVLAAAHAAGKPVLLLTVGRSAASGRAAASHTGALVSARATVEAVCRDAGALLLDTAGELVDTAVYLLAEGTRHRQAGRTEGASPLLHGVAVVGESRGQNALAAHAFAAQGLDVPVSADGTRDALAGASGTTPADPADAGATTSPRPRRVAIVGDSEGQDALAADRFTAQGLDDGTRDAPAARQPGGAEGTTPADLADAGATATASPRPRPRRVAVVGDSGGQGALAADAFAAQGLDVPAFSAGTREAVAEQLPGGAGCANPVDLAGAGEADLGSYARVAGTLLRSGDADAVVLTGYFGDYATANPAQADEECQVAHALADAAVDSGRALVVHTMARDTPALSVLRQRGVPVYERIEQAATAIAGAARLTGRPLLPEEPQTQAAYELTDGGYEQVRELLASYQLAFPAAEFVTDADSAVEAAERRTGYPVVLKAMGLAHKTEAGGVALSIGDADALRAAFARMKAATGADRYAVEAMATPPYGHELIVGVRRDPSFGPVVMVGIGGVTAELLADTALALAPVTHARARALLLELRHAALLTGWRGAPGVHLDAAAAAVCAVARAAVDHPELTELEVNPLLVHPGGAIALDAHGVLRQDN